MKAIINYFFVLEEDEQLDQSTISWLAFGYGVPALSVIITIIGGWGI